MLIALPVSIYVFLQAFGVNKFEIPIYYEKGISNKESNCPKGNGQHHVGNFISKDSTEQAVIDQIMIYHIGSVKENEAMTMSNNLLMLQEALEGWDNVVYRDYNLKTEELIKFTKCDLNLQFAQIQRNVILNDTLVLVDGKKRIRGYFGVLDRVEVDRLITEVNILLTE